MKKVKPFKVDSLKKEAIVNIRIEPELLEELDRFQKRKKIKNRSVAVRSILKWAFENDVGTA